MGSLVQLVMVVYVLYRLPVWLDSLPLFQCLYNWWAYGRWTACRHGQRDYQEVGEEMHVICCQCQVVLMIDHVRDFIRESRQPARFEGLRAFLLRWVLPPLRELRALCGFLGVLTLMGVLALWLSWTQVERTLMTCVSHSGTTSEERP